MHWKYVQQPHFIFLQQGNFPSHSVQLSMFRKERPIVNNWYQNQDHKRFSVENIGIRFSFQKGISDEIFRFTFQNIIKIKSKECQNHTPKSTEKHVSDVCII